MGITEQGIEGEQKLFSFLKKVGFDFFQPDAIGCKNGTYYMFEVKHQERYRPPPFEGHGLPLWQIKARLKFQKLFGIRCVLVVFDKETNEVFYQAFDTLEKGEKYDTKGAKPRRIYLVSSFKTYEPHT